MAAARRARGAGASPEPSEPLEAPESLEEDAPPKPSKEIPPGLAEPGQRLVARIVDTLVVGLPVVMVLRAAAPGADTEIVAPPAVAALLLPYEAIQLMLWGRTLGKRFAGIQVVPEDTDALAGAVQEEADALAGVVQEEEDGRAEAEGEGEAAGPDESEEPADPGGRRRRGLGVARSLLRSVTYALPVAARPVPVLGLLAGVFWVANAGLLYEGTRRQALHDRLARTIVVKRAAV